MIPLFKVHTLPLGELGIVVDEVFQSGVIAEGEYVQRFEQELAKFLEVPAERVVVVNSCTSALALAARLLDVGLNEPIISSPMTCFATNAPFAAAGAYIAWSDVDPTTGNIDPKSMQKIVWPASWRPRCILAVHWGGEPFDFDAVALAAPGVPIVADAAHALGARYKGRPIAECGDYVVFSFQAIKHLTCGDGGALVVKTAEEAARARRLRWFGLDRTIQGPSRWAQDIPEVGFKYNMNNISAAMGLAQLPYVPWILSMHRRNSGLYDQIIETRPGTVMKLRRHPDFESSCWVYSLLVDDPAAFRAHMEGAGVATDCVHVRNDKYSCFPKCREPLPGVAAFSDHLMNIPVGWWVTVADAERIAVAVNEYGRA